MQVVGHGYMCSRRQPNNSAIFVLGTGHRDLSQDAYILLASI